MTKVMPHLGLRTALSIVRPILTYGPYAVIGGAVYYGSKIIYSNTIYPKMSAAQKDMALLQRAIRAAAAKRRGQTSGIARRVKRLETGQSGKEWKVHDVNLSGNTDTGGVVLPLTQIAQGDTSLSREGLKVHLQSTMTRMTLTSHRDLDDTALVRVIWFFDTQNHGALPTVLEVLEASTPQSAPEHELTNRFIIIKDKVIAVQPLIPDMVVRRHHKFYKKFKGRRVFYIGTAATAASMGKGQLFMLLLTDASANEPGYLIQNRLRFTE